MIKFLTPAERDERYGSDENFRKFYSDKVLERMVEDQNHLHETVTDPPPILWIVLSIDREHFKMLPCVLYDLDDVKLKALPEVVQYALLQNAHLGKEHPDLRVISVIGSCYAWAKISEVVPSKFMEEVAKLPASVKEDPKAIHVVVLLSDFCEGNMSCTMKMSDDRKFTRLPTNLAVFTGDSNPLAIGLSALFKRSKQIIDNERVRRN